MHTYVFQNLNGVPPMEDEINNGLLEREFNSREDLKKHVSSVQAAIQKYEQHLYEDGNFGGSEQEKIKEWRFKLYQMMQKRNNFSLEKAGDFDELEGTAKIIHRQIRKADASQGLLDKSTLKLIGLNYTSGDVEKAITCAKKRLAENKRREHKEIRLIIVAFLIFLCTCVLILFDKFILRR